MVSRLELARSLTAGVRNVLVRIGHPARVLVVAFAVLIAVGTLVLWLPVSADGPGGTSFVEALFTATSAVCVTGLAVVDTQGHWSDFGTVVLLVLVQLGGLGIVTLATTVFLGLSERLGIVHLRALSAEVGVSALSDIRHLLRLIVQVTLAAEAFFALVLTLRFWTEHDMGFGSALGHGVFHSVSAWNNAGFSLFDGSLAGFVDDGIVSLAVAAAVLLGGLGFPVLRDVSRNRGSWQRWSLHTKLTVTASAVLLLAGFVAYLAFEWTNDATFGPLATHEKVYSAAFQSTQPRSGGFSTVETAELSDGSLLVTMALMFIGGGSASTAGGMKVTTFALLGFVMWAEIRGDRDVNVFGRHVPPGAQRQALTVALAGVGIVVLGTLMLLALDDVQLEDGLFESVSALGIVGLSTGVTAELAGPAKLVLVALMFLGRIGPLTLFVSLALRHRPNLFRYPEEQPLIG